MPHTNKREHELHQARWDTLQTLDELLDGPLNVLGFVWLALLLLELLGHLPAWATVINDLIWGVFVLDFVLSLTLAPDRLTYLRRNWLSALSLLAPALRFLRVFRGARLLRATRLTRGTRLFQILTRLNRGLKSLQRTFQRRKFGFVLLATLLVMLAGAAGMASFEAATPQSYGEWVYWTAMVLMSLGPETWPQTGEGKLLTALLGLFGFTVFGYITATLASAFVGADQGGEEPQKHEVDNAALLRELRALREEVQALRGTGEERFPSGEAPSEA